jgi:L-alanine-DL-glutamate epimerase-like enolase superfamily enzyme
MSLKNKSNSHRRWNVERLVDLRKKAQDFWLNVALEELLKEDGKESLIELALSTAIRIALGENDLEGRPTPKKEVSHA